MPVRTTYEFVWTTYTLYKLTHVICDNLERTHSRRNELGGHVVSEIRDVIVKISDQIRQRCPAVGVENFCPLGGQLLSCNQINERVNIKQWILQASSYTPTNTDEVVIVYARM